MNVGAVSTIGSFAGAGLAQRAGEKEQSAQDATMAQRTADAGARADAAAGIGTTNEDQHAADRDADGRRPWEIGGQRNPDEDPATPTAPSPPVADPTGQTGSLLDLVG